MRCSDLHCNDVIQTRHKKAVCLVSQFKIRIRLDQVPVPEAVLINAQQELQVVLLVPVHIKVGDLDPACQLEPGRKQRFDPRCKHIQSNCERLHSAVESHLLLSAGLAGTALCKGSNSSSCWMMDLALT